MRILNGITQNLNSWFIKVKKIKAIYHTMNMFRVEQKNFMAEGWCPVDRLEAIQHALFKASVSCHYSLIVCIFMMFNRLRNCSHLM